MINESKLRDKISRSGLKLGFISAQLSLSYQGFLNKLQGYTDFTTSEVQKISQILNLNPEARDDIFFTQEVGNEPTLQGEGGDDNDDTAED